MCERKTMIKQINTIIKGRLKASLEDATLMDIDLRKALLPHLFLLLRLPEEESPALQEQCALISLFAEFLKSPELLRVSQLNVARQAFGVWADIQSSGTIDPERLAAAISGLSGGGHLPLFIREQNAGLLISAPTLGTLTPEPSAEQVAACDRNCISAAAEASSTSKVPSENQTAVISTFPASLTTTEVMCSVAAPTFIYPATSVRVAFSWLLKSTDFAKQISCLDETKLVSSSVRLIQIASISCNKLKFTFTLIASAPPLSISHYFATSTLLCPIIPLHIRTRQQSFEIDFAVW